MKSLSPVLIPPAYFDWHKDIVLRKRNPCRTNLQSIHGLVEVRFGEYSAALRCSTLQNLSENLIFKPFRNDLKSCYQGKTKKLSELLKHISASQCVGALKWCPYCGLTRPESYDHYLPKELFPEFSANPQNLVACCSRCNSVKGARWKSENVRLFIHFYSDRLPEEQFLFVDLTHREGAFSAEFRITNPSETEDMVWPVVENHYKELRLLESYRANANDEITFAVNACVSHLRVSGSDAGAFLMNLATEEASDFGANHWRIVLWQALAQNSDFLNNVSNKAGKVAEDKK